MIAPLLCAAFFFAQHQEAPAAACSFTRTTTLAEAEGFLAGLRDLPEGRRLCLGQAGRTEEGRPILLVAAHPTSPTLDGLVARADGGLRILVVANIHAGEVEGKEALLEILAEIKSGEHADLLADCHLWCLPIYNADGNERIDRRNRVEQNGPEQGVGVRPNGKGLDLNRDFIKAEAAETRALLALVNAFDPQLVLDLHTTDGSYHGYHLTYATSLSPNTDPLLDRLARTKILEVARASAEQSGGLRSFDYGNLGPGESRVWATFDHRPRFGTNYLGLLNRVSVLVETYSYLPFEERVARTRLFVLEVLRAAQAARADLLATLERLDREAAAGAPILFRTETAPAPPHEATVLLGEVREVALAGLGTRREALPEVRALRLLVQDRFLAARCRVLPEAYAIPGPTAGDEAILARHGLAFRRLETAEHWRTNCFHIERTERATSPFQGHHELTLTGAFESGPETLPAGTLLVPTRQPRARLVAQLLDPESEDSLFTWNHFDERLTDLAPVLLVLGP